MNPRYESIANARPDPVLHFVELPLTAVYHPYGFPVLIRANSRAVLEAATESWGMFAAEFPRQPVELLVVVTEPGGSSFPPPPAVRSQRHLMTFSSDAGHSGVCDFAAGLGSIWITLRILEDREFFRFHFLEAMANCLLSERHLAAVHSAAVAYKGRGLLLCGDSGAGKSSLAYACARRGWTYTSDDGSYLVRSENGCTVVGNPHRIRLRPSAADLFPELAGQLARPRPNGKLSLELATADLLDFSTAASCQIERIVFLNRRGGPTAAVLPFSKEAAYQHLEGTVCFGTEGSQRDQREALWRVLAQDPVELAYGDFDAAIDCLELLLTARD